MRFSCGNPEPLIAHSGIRATRRNFGLGLGSAFALPGLAVLSTMARGQPAAAALSPQIRTLHAAIDADAPRLIEIFKDISRQS
ncbi:hypothetical protein [Reyranella sp.]|uniref:hypothetical protein n=1 Tax=Reyranella sp. TaxID=1929291 RepID=UPI0037841319